MILYLDSSSIIKLYLLEESSGAIRAAYRRSSIVATSLVAYAETRAGLARARRAGRVSEQAYSGIHSLFEADWATFLAIDIDATLVRLAGDLVERRPLRGFDAIHLASALRAQRSGGEGLLFSSSDAQLLTAASTEGLAVL